MTNRPLLAVDIGNTDTVLAVYRGAFLVADWRCPSSQLRTGSRAAEALRLLFAEAGSAERDARGAVISSVVPLATKELARVIRARLGRAPYVVSGANAPGTRIGYRDPASIGPDRVCNAVAARAAFGAPVIVIDLGTATTYDVVTRSGLFAGGAIAPGIATAAAALSSRTAALPAVPLAFPDGPVGRDTVSGIQSGVLFGALDAMEGMIRRLRAVTGRGTTVVATGGFAPLVAAHSRSIDHVVPHLVLDGARILFERRERSARRR